MEPWRAKLEESDAAAAWDLFIERYQRLIFATIRHIARDRDDVLDVFARVCEALRADDLARLRRWVESAEQRARFSTWLVTVVHNLAIDWVRQRDGRPRSSVPSALSPIQRQIFEHLANGLSHVEAYEAIRGAGDMSVSFGAFLRELKHTYRALGPSASTTAPRQVLMTPLDQMASLCEEPAPIEEAKERIGAAMGALSAEESLAVQLFVVDEMSAADVALMVGWPNAKTVYNRVYRALTTLRGILERQGIRRGDL